MADGSCLREKERKERQRKKGGNRKIKEITNLEKKECMKGEKKEREFHMLTGTVIPT